MINLMNYKIPTNFEFYQFSKINKGLLGDYKNNNNFYLDSGDQYSDNIFINNYTTLGLLFLVIKIMTFLVLIWMHTLDQQNK
jgi:hypothetical protein